MKIPFLFLCFFVHDDKNKMSDYAPTNWHYQQFENEMITIDYKEKIIGRIPC